MRVLVTGASGLLGRRVLKKLKSVQMFDVIGTCFSRTANSELVRLDLTNNDELKDWFDKHQPEAIVHCAAERRPDVVEKDPDRAYAVNVKSTQMLCDLANKYSCWMLFISTDYVFDGKKAPYGEGDTPNPLNSYGRTKLEGEEVVLSSALRNAVLRVPILYGPIEYLGESAVTVLYNKVKDTLTPCEMDHRQRRYPTHTDTVSDLICQMLSIHQQQPDSLTGIYHLSDTTMLTKYDMAVKMADVMNHPQGHIKADTAEPSETHAPRPYDCQLGMNRLQQAGLSMAGKDFSIEIKSVLSEYLNAHPGV